MRCKVGDLAVIVRASYPENVGLFVAVVEPVPDWTPAGWFVDGGGPGNCCYDHDLRPIRDQPGEDEMIRIAGLPQNLKETA